MENIAVRAVKTQRKEIKSVNNYRFEESGYEYRLTYVGGIGEFVTITGRKKGDTTYEYITGFHAYPFRTRREVIEHAVNLVK